MDRFAVETGRHTAHGCRLDLVSRGRAADSAPVATRYFRRAFDLPAGDRVTSARFKLSADDRFTLYVNGKETARSPDVADSWNTATVVDISDDLRSGRNVIAIEAANAAAARPG